MKGKIRIFLFAVLNLAFAITASPQREAENWIFGYGIHMNFSTGSPVLQPQIPGGFAALNGTTTISDRNGNLLFYSNGTFIYNRHRMLSHHSQCKFLFPRQVDVSIYLCLRKG